MLSKNKNRPNHTEYPFHPHYFHINNHALHYIQEGQGELILFIHGTPSWSFEFRNIIKSLSDKYQCIAPDFIGFGRSDKPRNFDYSPKAQSEILEKFILQKNLKNIHLVVHDFGGPIAIQTAIRHPGRIKNLIILNSWMWSQKNESHFKAKMKLLKNPLIPFLYRYFNFSARFLLPKTFGKNKITKKILKGYTAPFIRRKEREAPLAFARSLVEDQNWFDELWQKRKLISHIPALILWGMKDPTIPSSYIKKWEEVFLTSKSIKFHTSGHFPQEEQPEKVAKEIQTFIQTCSDPTDHLIPSNL